MPPKAGETGAGAIEGAVDYSQMMKIADFAHSSGQKLGELVTKLKMQCQHETYCQLVNNII